MPAKEGMPMPPTTGTLDALLVEQRVFRPAPATVIEANIKPSELAEAYALAAADHLAYWEKAALELEWRRKWDAVLDDSRPPFYRWFPGAQGNIAHNALDRHVHAWTKNKLALIWEGEAGDCRKFTYFELYREVNRLAGALRGLGVGRGDRVCLYMPPIPETVVAMLAAAKIGAPHVFVFAGYSAKALRERLNDSRAKVVITADGFYRGGRMIDLKAVVDEALPGVRPEAAESVVVVRRTGHDIDMQEPRDLYYHDLLRQESPEAPTEVMEADEPLFWLHTSGSTGKPKAVIHGHAGYMVGAHHTFRTVFDVKPTDIHFCTADPGWITGHTYGVYGPLLTGATVILYEGHPLYPQADRLPSIIERYGATIFYATPTLIRMLMRYGPQYPKKRDLSTLRLLGSVGEPLGPEAWMWLYKHFGGSKCPLLDTWWQTETGMAMIAPMPISVLKPGSVGKALPGIEARGAGPGRLSGHQEALAGHVPGPGGRPGRLPRRLLGAHPGGVFRRRRGPARRGRLFLDSGPGGRGAQHRRPPGGHGRGGGGADGAPFRGRSCGHRAARQDQGRGGQGVCRARSGLDRRVPRRRRLRRRVARACAARAGTHRRHAVGGAAGYVAEDDEREDFTEAVEEGGAGGGRVE
jgi:acetyl-CoA synthetase